MIKIILKIEDYIYIFNISCNIICSKYSIMIIEANNGQYVTGGGNVGTIGYALYGAVKPDWSQTSPGTIKLQMKVF